MKKAYNRADSNKRFPARNTATTKITNRHQISVNFRWLGLGGLFARPEGLLRLFFYFSMQAFWQPKVHNSKHL